MKYEYKLLRQFTMTVGGTRCYSWLKQSQATHCRATQSLFAHISERQWLKCYWILQDEYPETSQTNYGELVIF